MKGIFRVFGVTSWILLPLINNKKGPTTTHLLINNSFLPDYEQQEVEAAERDNIQLMLI